MDKSADILKLILEFETALKNLAAAQTPMLAHDEAALRLSGSSTI